MPFDPFVIMDKIETVSPHLARTISMEVLQLVSPFNAHLRCKLTEWTNERSLIELKLHRRVKNHVGSIHAGALFTLGETCAGVIIVRSFPFKSFRPLMNEVSVSYFKQARGTVYGRCELTPKMLEGARQELAKGVSPFLKMETHIENEKKESVALVKTQWQIKPWQNINTKS